MAECDPAGDHDSRADHGNHHPEFRSLTRRNLLRMRGAAGVVITLKG